MKKIFTTIAIIIFGTGTVAGAIFYRQGLHKDTEIRVRQSQIAALNERLARLDSDRKTLQDQIAETNAHLSELKDNNRYIIRLESVLKEKEAAVSSARRAAIRCSGATEKLMIQLADEKKSTQALNELLAGSQSRIQTLKGQIEKNREADAAVIADLKHRYISGRKSEGEVRQKLNEATERVAVEKEAAEALRDDLDAAGRKISGLEAQIIRNTIAYRDLKKQITGMASQKGSVEERLHEIKSAYDGLVKELNENIKHKEATIQECEEKLAVSFIDRILFRSAAVAITPEGKAVLKKTGDILKKLKHGKFRIIGHTDAKPIRSRLQRRFPSNWELSSARAGAVARFFEAENGIPSSRMEIVGESHNQPIADNNTEAGRVKNRRVEIIVVPELWPGATGLNS